METPNRIDESVYLTPQQVRAMYGLSRQTMRRYEAEGYIIPVRLPSGHRRWSRAELEALLSRGDAA